MILRLFSNRIFLVFIIMASIIFDLFTGEYLLSFTQFLAIGFGYYVIKGANHIPGRTLRWIVGSSYRISIIILGILLLYSSYTNDYYLDVLFRGVGLFAFILLFYVFFPKREDGSGRYLSSERYND